jgi:hypothetical protein
VRFLKTSSFPTSNFSTTNGIIERIKPLIWRSPMKSLLVSFVAGTLLVSSLAQASEVNFEIYHPHQPLATAAQRPGIPKLTAPAPLAAVNGSEIKLEWKKLDEATAYAVQLSNDPIFFNLLINEPLYKDTSLMIKDVKLESGKTYYWRVAAVKEDNQPGTIKSLFNRSSFIVK